MYDSWTKKEIRFLSNNYLIKSYAEIGKILKRSETSIAQKIGDLKLKQKYKKWSSEEVRLLFKKYEISTTEELMEYFPNRNIGTINKKAEKLGLKRKNTKIKIWKHKEIQKLKNLFNNGLSDKEIGDILQRTELSVRKQIRNLKLCDNRQWKQEEIKILINNCNNHTINDLCDLFPNRTRYSIEHKLRKLNLKAFQPYVWLEEEISKLRILFKKGYTNKEIANILGKNICVIKRKKRILNLRIELNHYSSEWTNEEIEMLKKCYSDLTIKDAYKLFPNKGYRNILKKARELSLKRNYSILWTSNEIELLKEKYPIMTKEELKNVFPHKTDTQIKNKAKNLRLRKNKDTFIKCLGGDRGGEFWERKTWNRKILKRDEFQCQECGLIDKTGCDLRAHHIIPQRDPNCDKLDLENGICLCVKCHNSVYMKEYEFVDKFKKIAQRRQHELCKRG